MINKEKLWFITLLSIILVLGVFYITMPSELLKSTNNVNKTQKVNKEVTTGVEESDMLVALRVEHDEQAQKELEELQSVLTSASSTNEEKNNAFEELKNLNLTKGKEEELENKLMDEFKTKTFIKIDNDTITVVINSKEHNVKLANDIMRSIQSSFDEKKYITIKFQIK